MDRGLPHGLDYPDEQARDPWALVAEGNDASSGQLWEAVEALPPLHRSVLMLRVRDGIPAEVVHYCTRLTPNQQRGVLGNIRYRFRNTNLKPLLALAARVERAWPAPDR